MTVAISTLVQRVRELVNEHHHWFEAVAAWYDSAKWTKKIFTDYLTARNRPAGRAVLSVNDRTLEDPFRDRQAPAAAPTWWIPASVLHAGENQLRLWIEQKSSAVSIDGINVEHLPELTVDTKRDHRPQPKPSAQMALAVALGAGYRPNADRWSVEVDQQTVRLALHFERDVPAQFLLGVTVKLPTIGYALILDDLWDFVADSVKKKIKKLAKEYYRRLEARDPQADLIEAQLRDLHRYLELHESHLAHALAVSDDTTLEQVIERSRQPLRSASPPPLTVEPVKESSRPMTVEPVKQPPRPVRPPQPRPSSSGLGCIARVVVVFFLLGVTAAATLSIAWYLGMINMQQLGLANLGGGDARENELDEILRAKGAQTGDVQVSLQWFNKNDLDLEVVAPSGEKLFWGHRDSKCGGKLDIDMNVVYDAASNKAVENVFWPKGGAPKGKYQVFVNHFHNHNKPDTADPTRFSVRVVNRGVTKWFHDEVVHNDAKKRRILVHEFEVR